MNAQVVSGKFSNDDGGGIENLKNAIVSISKATNLLACHTFWCFNCLALCLTLYKLWCGPHAKDSTLGKFTSISPTERVVMIPT